MRERAREDRRAADQHVDDIDVLEAEMQRLRELQVCTWLSTALRLPACIACSLNRVDAAYHCCSWLFIQVHRMLASFLSFEYRRSASDGLLPMVGGRIAMER